MNNFVFIICSIFNLKVRLNKSNYSPTKVNFFKFSNSLILRGCVINIENLKYNSYVMCIL